MRHKSCKFNMQMGSKPVCGLQMIQQLFTWSAAKRVALHFIPVNRETKHEICGSHTVTMKSTLLCNVTPCSLVKAYRHFRRT
jgi:hypothetical protein